MATTKQLKTQIGLQSAFGTAVTPTEQAPWVVEYEDTRVLHEPEMDSGARMPVERVMALTTGAEVTVSGDAMFEMLPVLLSAGIDAVTTTGAGAPYTDAYEFVLDEAGDPLPLTFVTGAVGEDIGATGPAVQLKDLYVRSLTLASNINDKIVSLEAELFGTGYDDSSGAGYEFTPALTIPASVESMVGTRGELSIQDAATTGGDFTTMTAFSCALIDWTLNITTGLEPLWCLCDNTDSWVGVQNVVPEVTFEATIRTTETNYALVKGAHIARTYQELQLIVNGEGTSKLTVNMTGRWTECGSAHARENDEVVMAATFSCRVPAIQTTTPHFCDITVLSGRAWNPA